MEKREIIEKIKELESQFKPLQEELNKIYRSESEIVTNKIKSTHKGLVKFTEDELIFAATSRCQCGAGLAYPKNVGIDGSWDCSDILLGLAIKSGEPDAKTHSGEMPFTFYEIKSENQPSANGATTRRTPQ